MNLYNIVRMNALYIHGEGQIQMNQAKWNFPNNGGGQVRGIADSGIETFRANRLRALAREICQNSLDAGLDGKCVRVEFEHRGIHPEEIPGYGTVRKAFKDAKDYWDTQKSADAKVFLDQANKVLNSEFTFLVLRASDYNTTGLSHPFDYKSMEGWNTLTRLDGGATKVGESSGSYGIGKNAPFVNSTFRMVFYRPLNQAGERAAQGMMRLLSFPKDGNLEAMTTGFGYYGNSDHNLPVHEIPELEKLNHREGTGTDVFIYGFHPPKDLKGSSWMDDIRVEILSNFIISVWTQKMTVSFIASDAKQRIELNKSTLGRFAEKYRNLDKDSYNTWLLLKNPDKVKRFTLNFHDMGTVTLDLYTGDEELNRKVLVVRKSGMKLFHMMRLSQLVNFTGLLELNGRELNEYFRKMETQDHTKWEPTLHTSNPSKARKYIKEIRDWVQQQVNSLSDEQVGESIEIQDLGSLLNESGLNLPGKEESDDGEKGKETFRTVQPAIEVEEIPVKKKHRGILSYLPDRKPGGTTEKIERTKGRITGDGDTPVIRTLKGTRHRKKIEAHRGIEDPEGQDILQKPVGAKRKDVPLQFVRIMKVGPGTYRLLFNSPRPVKSGEIELVAVGENGKDASLTVVKAGRGVNLDNVSVKDGKILFSHMSGKDRMSVDFTLSAQKEYAMEVHAVEDY